MAGLPITAEEITKAAQWMHENGLTPERVGRVNLGRAIGVSEARAKAILNKLRYASPSKQLPSAEATDDPLSAKRLQMENSDLRSKLNESLSRQVIDQRYQDFISEVAETKREYPKWAVEPRKGKHSAMPVAHLSDWHFDETVDPRQVGFVNAYNREIATNRLRRFFEKTVEICDSYLKGVDYPGIVLPVSGDMFSGNIHQELRETNEAPLTESLVYWIDQMAAGISLLAERFGKVFVPWVVGNHPRMTQKPAAKNGPTDNFDWLMGAMLARDFKRAKDSRVQFQIAESFDNYFRIFSSQYCQTHGDQFKGGAGISGLATPLALGDARKRKRSQAMRLPYDYLIIGHWHTRLNQPVVKVNGTGKGFDEYSFKMNFDYQQPQQSFWLDTPEYKITLEMPVFVKCPNEGWERQQTEQQAVFEAA